VREHLNTDICESVRVDLYAFAPTQDTRRGDTNYKFVFLVPIYYTNITMNVSVLALMETQLGQFCVFFPSYIPIANVRSFSEFGRLTTPTQQYLRFIYESAAYVSLHWLAIERYSCMRCAFLR